MKVNVMHKQIQAMPVDAIIVNLFEGHTVPSGGTGAVDTSLGASDGKPGDGMISQLIRLGDFKGKLNEVVVLYTGMIPSPRVILVGLGKSSEFTPDRARQASGAAARKARDLGCKRVASISHGAGVGGLNPHSAAQATVEGAILGTYQFREHKSTNNENGKELDEFILVEANPSKVEDVTAGAHGGAIIANAVNAARTMINRAPNVLNPASFATFAQEMAERVGLKCTVLTEREIAEQKMGGVIAVSQGSANPPRFVILEHIPNNPQPTTDPSSFDWRSEGSGQVDQPLVFIGKGVTFDTGGISIKPAENMQSMKADMGGAAAVFGAMQAIAELKAPRRVIGITPLVENMPSDRSYRPADVITMMSGLTVEIISTDAEGRMILADALHYAKQFKPRGVVDLATLTGACVVALGEGIAAGLFSNDDAWAGEVMKVADETGERVWRMPLYPEYDERIKSDVAEIKNSGGRNNGVGTSAYFLKRFVDGDESYPWAHIDMAGMMFNGDTKGYQPKGAMGFGARLLVNLAQTV